MTTARPFAIEGKGLRKRFGGLTVLEDLNVHFEVGKLSAIIGPNGAGKTTCFNLLTGFLTPDSGQIYYQGHDITQLTPERRARLGISRSFQILNLFDSFTVLENIRVAVPAMRRRGLDFWRPADLLAEAKERASAIIRLIGLAGRESVEAKYLSYGQRRLLEIGVCLAAEPQVLLLDEPTTGLGSRPKETLHDLICRLLSDLTIIIIEHNMDFVMSLADTITVLHRGRAIARGSPESIRDNAEVRSAYLGDWRSN